jgi:crotonobetaine/carnitine-CoA ligase
MSTPATACITRDLLEHHARHHPHLMLLRFDTGESYSAAALLTAVQRHAAGLQALGVKQDDYVLSWLPNGSLAVLAWLALNWLGAIYVPINTAYKGRLLQHVVQNSGARLMIADGRLLERLADVVAPHLQQVVVSGPERPALRGLTLRDASALAGDASTLRDPPRTLRDSDTQCVIFTSGTTGRSKGVLCSYKHTCTAAREFRHVGPGDTNLVALPMFHIGGILGVNFALIHGGTAAFVERFRTETFWETVKRLDVTSVGLLGTMVQFLMQQPVRADERGHRVKNAVIAPFTEDALAFGRRFGIDVHTEFNMTELSVPLWAGPNPTAVGACGKPRAGLELRLVDAFDNEVPPGETGELILRSAEPWTFSHGYLNDPQATANAWRNGWFHTGDLFRRDSDDNYFFVDRAKDMIRRRGENISSFEVEAELLAFPGVKAAAAVAVPGDGGEDEVLAVLAPQPGAAIDPAALVRFLEPRMAAFMLPRYVRVMEELPLTPTQKIEKHVLRAEGVTADTWDRQAAGMEPPADILRHPRESGDPASSASAGARKRLDSRPPPSRGQASKAGNDDSGTTATAADSSETEAAVLPLLGIQVLEFAGLGPAPFCGMLLSDMGAEVLRIDRPGTVYAPADVEARGRRSVFADLKTLEGKELARALMRQSDILIEGYRPGVMERLGLGPEVALQQNPKLVYGRMTGWGQDGPLAHKAGHDLNYLALSGALHALGTKAQPAVPLNLIADFGGGALYLAMGVLAALHRARQGGQGCVVDAAMTEGVISMMGMIYGDFADGRWVDARESNVIDGAAPFYNVYECADGKWLSLAAIEPQFYNTFIEVAEGAGPPFDKADFQEQWNRARWPQMKQNLDYFFRTRPRDEWCALFDPYDVCIAPVLSLAEAQQHSHNRARASFAEHDGILQPAPTPRFWNKDFL